MARPPPVLTRVTLSLKVLVPRWHSTTLLRQVDEEAVHKPPLTQPALAVVCLEPAIGLAANWLLPMTSGSLASGVVLKVSTPGPDSSTSALNCEKLALTLFWS